MPCIEEWLSKPLFIVENIAAEDGDSYIKQVKEYFTQRLSNQGINRVPSVNEQCLDTLQPNTLVRFRCMIQDMFEPEYYLSSYETVEKTSSKKAMSSGIYRDVAYCKPGYKVDLNSTNNVTKERQCFYCVPIPAETSWTKKAYEKTPGFQYNDFKNTKTEVAHSLKRDYNDLQKSNLEDMSDWDGTEQDKRDPKRVKDEAVEAPKRTVAASESLDLNLPLSDGSGPACIVKVYSDFDTFKVNDIVEFVGVLSVDPILTGFNDQSNQVSSLEMDVDDQNPLSLPSSLVPRIHAVVEFKLKHSNPLICIDSSPSENIFSDLAHARGLILNVLEQLLYGDSVAAEYLLLHLLSTVYSRPDILALGKYTLNLIGCSKDVAVQIAKMVEHLVPKCHKFPMTISNLNQSKLVPKKDYTANRLISGKLQLSDGTHLILDETVLEEGRLDTTGVQNIAALNHIIQWQKVPYDFTFYKTDFTSNIVILVLSEGKSLLQADSHVRLEVKKPPISFDNIVENSPDGLFDNIRKYLGMARLVSYEIFSDLKKHIENDFVEMRQASPREMTVERFHSLLCLARLMAISYGRTHLAEEDWIKTKELEKTRLCRLPQDS